MNYPIFLSGRQVGKLNVSRDGLYTLFQARLPGISGLYRLWLQGSGETAALGLLAPGPGGLVFRRRMSRLEMKNLPGKFERALVLRPDIKPKAERPKKTVEKPAEAEGKAEPPGLTWQSLPDGSLTAGDGERRLVALPAALRRETRGVRLKEIEGRLYMIFRY